MCKFHKLFSGGSGCFYFAHVINPKQKFLTEPSSANIGDLIGTIRRVEGGNNYVLQESNFGMTLTFNSLTKAESHMAMLIELRE